MAEARTWEIWCQMGVLDDVIDGPDTNHGTAIDTPGVQVIEREPVDKMIEAAREMLAVADEIMSGRPGGLRGGECAALDGRRVVLRAALAPFQGGNE